MKQAVNKKNGDILYYKFDEFDGVEWNVNDASKLCYSSVDNFLGYAKELGFEGVKTE